MCPSAMVGRHLIASTETAGNDSDSAFVHEIHGVLLHEMVHVLQHPDGPSGLIEGIADWCRLKAGWAAAHWNEGLGGDKWDAGYE